MIERLKRRRSLLELLQRCSAVGLGSFIGQAILILSAPLLARFYGPTEIGVSQLVLTLGGIFWIVCSLRYEQAIPIADNDSEKLLLASIAIGVCVTMILALLILTLRSEISDLMQIGRPELLWFVPLSVLCSTFYQSGRMTLLRHGLFKPIGLSMTVQSLVCVAWQVWFGAQDSDKTLQLLLGLLIGQLAGTFIIFTNSTFRTAVLFSKMHGSLTSYCELLKRYKNFPLYTVPYAFVSQSSRRAIFFLLGIYCGGGAVGLCILAQKLTYVPVSIVTTALGQAFYREAAFESDRRELAIKALTLASILLAIASPVGVLLVVYSDYMTRLLLGPDWEGMIPYFQWQVFPAVTLLITNWLDRLYDVYGKQKLATQLELGFDAIALGALWSMLAFGYSAISSVACYSVISAMYNLFWLFVTFKISGFGTQLLSRMLAPHIFKLVCFTAIVVLIRQVSTPLWGCALGCAIMTIMVVHFFTSLSWEFSDETALQ